MKILFIFIFTLLNLPGCSIIKRKGRWGKDALWPISGRSISHSFKKNITSPHVWIPLAGAGAIHFSDYDQKISEWASSQTPIYGSQKNASDYGSHLNDILIFGAYASIFLTPSWDGSSTDYLTSKLKGGAVAYFSIRLPRDVNNRLRGVISRRRPNETDMRSLPSGHAAEAGASSGIIRKNGDQMKLKKSWHTVLNGLNTTIAMGTLWSRVEANAHYPSDVMVGYAVGTFVSGFIFDSLMNLDPNESLVISSHPLKPLSATYTFIF